jgi:hypothetical protein
MRKILFPLLLLAGFILIFSGCVSEDVLPAAAEEVAAEEADMQTRRVVEEVQLVSRELSYYPDGVLASYRVYTYADEGTQKLQEALYNSDDELLERLVYKYEDGNYRSKQTYEGLGELLQTYDGNGELQNYHTFEYNDAGLLTEDVLYNQYDEPQTRQEYEYDPRGNRTKWSVFNGEGALLSRSEYLYEDGLNTRIENYNPDGSLLDYFKLEYDSSSRLIRRTWYSAEDEVMQVHCYIYEDGVLSEERVLRGNGSLKRRVVYTSNRAGYPVEAVYLDGGDNIQEQTAYEYVTRTRVTYQKVKE